MHVTRGGGPHGVSRCRARWQEDCHGAIHYKRPWRLSSSYVLRVYACVSTSTSTTYVTMLVFDFDGVVLVHIVGAALLLELLCERKGLLDARHTAEGSRIGQTKCAHTEGVPRLAKVLFKDLAPFVHVV